MLVGGILGYVFCEKVETTMRNTMLGSIRLYDQNKAIANAWDATQTRLKCCGVTSYEEWISVPDSCCKPPAINKLQRCHLLISQNDTSSLYRNGCLNVTTAYVKENAALIGGAGIVVACLMVCDYGVGMRFFVMLTHLLFQLFGMIFSCALIKLIE